MPRPIRAYIRPFHLAENLNILRRLAPDTQMMAVIKANAYGHGIERIYSGLYPAHALALLDLAEANTLRRLGWQRDITLLEGVFDAADWQQVAALSLNATVHQAEQVDSLLQWLGQGVDFSKSTIFIKINTGMNRLGFLPAEVPGVYGLLKPWLTQGRLFKAVLMTHYANADRADASALPVSVQSQWEALKSCQRAVLMVHGDTLDLSAANSAAILHHADKTGDMTRPGVSIYGADASDTPAAYWGLKPVMHLRSEVIAVQRVQAGESVGYGSRWTADAPCTIAVIACGYADGYPRHAPNGTPVLVRGVRCPLVGRVSMDMLAVDVSALPQVQAGEEVVLWGDGLPIDEVAKAAGTIGYELMCAITSRVPFIVEAA